jgi:hypothetical protein
MHIYSDEPHHHLQLEETKSGDAVGKTTTTDPCSKHTRASRGGGQLQIAGSQPIELTACPTCVLPEPPSRNPANLRRAPDTTAPGQIFMPLQPAQTTLRARDARPDRVRRTVEPTPQRSPLDRDRGSRWARPAPIAAQALALGLGLHDDGRGQQAPGVFCPIPALPSSRHIHHPLTRGGPTNGVRPIVLSFGAQRQKRILR